MGTVADKLNKVLSTKEAIKAAVIEKGQTVADTDTFASYPDKIRAIETAEEPIKFRYTFGSNNNVYVSVYAYDYKNAEFKKAMVRSSDYYGQTAKFENQKIGSMIIVKITSISSAVASFALDSSNTDVAINTLTDREIHVAITGPNPHLNILTNLEETT